MKVNLFKKLLAGTFVVFLAGGILIAQSQGETSSASEEVESSFSDMTEGERIAKLEQLRDEQKADGNEAAAAYLQGRIDFLNN